MVPAIKFAHIASFKENKKNKKQKKKNRPLHSGTRVFHFWPTHRLFWLPNKSWFAMHENWTSSPSRKLFPCRCRGPLDETLGLPHIPTDRGTYKFYGFETFNGRGMTVHSKWKNVITFTDRSAIGPGTVVTCSRGCSDPLIPTITLKSNLISMPEISTNVPISWSGQLDTRSWEKKRPTIIISHFLSWYIGRREGKIINKWI